MSHCLPALFVGHGSPMNAIQHNRYTEAWSAIGRDLPTPRSILCVSAHWYTRGSALTINTAPETIHDFGGFPRELYQVRYPAPGDPELARRVQKLLSPVRAELSSEWGLDHGAWSVLQHVYPNADVPVVQLSIDAAQPPPFHYEVGRRLEELRQEGVLILGSGNVVHNLRAYDQTGTADPLPWAEAFETRARELILAGEHSALVNYTGLGREAMLSIPTPEHYLPLLYILGAGSEAAHNVKLPLTGIDGGSVSMLAAQFG